MKKIITLIALVVLSNCEIKPRHADAQNSNGNYSQRYSYHEETHNGMTYGIWSVDDDTSQTGYATSVVNLTKDALEVEHLRQQIANGARP